jgi:CRISPR/Cas system-associated protein Csx1
LRYDDASLFKEGVVIKFEFENKENERRTERVNLLFWKLEHNASMYVMLKTKNVQNTQSYAPLFLTLVFLI